MPGPFDPNNTNRTPYMGTLGERPETPVAAPPIPPTSNSQLASRNMPGTPGQAPMGMGHLPAPAPQANYFGTSQHAPGPGADFSMGYGHGPGSKPNPYGPDWTNPTTAGGYEMLTQNSGTSVINPDTGLPYNNGGDVRAFTGSGGISQFGNPNNGLLGGDPNNPSNSLGGTGTYANYQNQRLQQMADNAQNRGAPQMQMDATNAALGQTNATLGLGMNALNQSGQTNADIWGSGNNMRNLATGQGVQGQFGSADRLMQLSQMPAGPSVAEQAMRMQSGANERSQAALAAGARGGNSALALNNAASNAAGMGGQLQQQIGMQRAQEDMANRQFSANAAQAAGGVYGQAAGNQLNAYGGAANAFGQVANNQMNQANQYGQFANNQLNQAQIQAGMAGQQLGADVASRGQNDVAAMGYMNMGYGLQNNDRNAAMQREQNLINTNTDIYGINQKVAEERAQRSNDNTWKEVGAGAQAVGTVAGVAASDVRAKKNIQPANAQVSDAFRAANNSANALNGTDVQYPMSVGRMPDAPAYSYEYRNPNASGAKPGINYGPMAQDLERTPAGASVVVQKPNGMKGIDTSRLSLLNTSELSKQRQELDALKASMPRAIAAPQVSYPNPYMMGM